MGTVYLVTHLMLSKSVALKVIKPELVTSKGIVDRFRREARAAGTLNHPRHRGRLRLRAGQRRHVVHRDGVRGRPELAAVTITTATLPKRSMTKLRLDRGSRPGWWPGFSFTGTFRLFSPARQVPNVSSRRRRRAGSSVPAEIDGTAHASVQVTSSKVATVKIVGQSIGTTPNR